MTVEATSGPGAQGEEGSSSQAGGSQDNSNQGTPPAKGQDGQGTGDNPNWDEATKNYIKSLRDESAKHRTKAKNLEGETTTLRAQVETFQSSMKKALGLEAEGKQMSVEDQVNILSQQTAGLEMRGLLLETAIHNGIGKDGLEYYEFLVGKKLNSLGEGEELDELALGEIAKEVQAKSSKNFGSTSVTGANQPAPGETGGVTVDQFKAMSLSDKSTLYTKNRDLYEKLRSQIK